MRKNLSLFLTICLIAIVGMGCVSAIKDANETSWYTEHDFYFSKDSYAMLFNSRNIASEEKIILNNIIDTGFTVGNEENRNLDKISEDNVQAIDEFTSLRRTIMKDALKNLNEAKDESDPFVVANKMFPKDCILNESKTGFKFSNSCSGKLIDFISFSDESDIDKFGEKISEKQIQAVIDGPILSLMDAAESSNDTIENILMSVISLKKEHLQMLIDKMNQKFTFAEETSQKDSFHPCDSLSLLHSQLNILNKEKAKVTSSTLMESIEISKNLSDKIQMILDNSELSHRKFSCGNDISISKMESDINSLFEKLQLKYETTKMEELANSTHTEFVGKSNDNIYIGDFDYQLEAYNSKALVSVSGCSDVEKLREELSDILVNSSKSIKRSYNKLVSEGLYIDNKIINFGYANCKGKMELILSANSDPNLNELTKFENINLNNKVKAGKK